MAGGSENGASSCVPSAGLVSEQWYVGVWSECVNATKSRVVLCRNQDTQLDLPDVACLDSPPARETCCEDCGPDDLSPAALARPGPALWVAPLIAALIGGLRLTVT